MADARLSGLTDRKSVAIMASGGRREPGLSRRIASDVSCFQFAVDCRLALIKLSKTNQSNIDLAGRDSADDIDGKNPRNEKGWTRVSCKLNTIAIFGAARDVWLQRPSLAPVATFLIPRAFKQTGLIRKHLLCHICAMMVEPNDCSEQKHSRGHGGNTKSKAPNSVPKTFPNSKSQQNHTTGPDQTR